jgi:hypothetical protein
MLLDVKFSKHTPCCGVKTFLATWEDISKRGKIYLKSRKIISPEIELFLINVKIATWEDISKRGYWRSRPSSNAFIKKIIFHLFFYSISR